MSNEPLRPPPSGLERLHELARAHLTGAGPRRDASSLALVQQRLEKTRRFRQRATWLASCAALVAALLGARAFIQRGQTPLEMQASNGDVSSTGLVSPAADATTLRFSDGTQVVVERASRAQVVAVSALGADLRLEHGQLHLQVAKRSGASWNVLAGAYRVHVTGTSLAVDFDETINTLEVELFSGSVQVSGPLLEQGVNVTAGQRLSVDAKGGGFRLASSAERSPEVDPSGKESPEPLVQPSGVSPEPARVPPRKQRPRPQAVPAVSWQSSVASGQFDQVLQAAEKQGLDGVYQTASLEDLSALADAARYARRSTIARDALVALRRRFSDSAKAKEAAFLLGRLAEDASDRAAALDWYELYGREDPVGVFASQALGRKLLLVYRQRGAAAVQPVAREYLQRFPTGPYAERARELVAGR